MIAADLGRAALLATIPIAYALDALTIAAALRRRFLIGTLSVFFYVSYSTLFVSLVPRERYVEANVAPQRQPRALVRRRAERRRRCSCRSLSAPVALARRRVLVPRLGALRSRRIAPDEPPTETGRARPPAARRALHLRARRSSAPRCSRRRRSTSSTSSSSRCSSSTRRRTLHVSPARSGSSSARRGRRPWSARVVTGRIARADRRRAGVRARLRALPGAARARPARRRAAAGSCSRCSSSPSSARASA